MQSRLRLVTETETQPKMAEDVIRRAFRRALRGCSAEYERRHMAAWQGCTWGSSASGAPAASVALANMLRALGQYVDGYHRRYPEFRLGGDIVLGEAWEQMLSGFLTLLNGELGWLDGGALDAAARDLHRWAGFDTEL